MPSLWKTVTRHLTKKRDKKRHKRAKQRREREESNIYEEWKSRAPMRTLIKQIADEQNVISRNARPRLVIPPGAGHVTRRRRRTRQRPRTRRYRKKKH